MNKIRPIALNALKFSDRTGNMILTEEYNLSFASSLDAEKFIQERYRYWTGLIDKELVIAPSMNETMDQIEIRKTFKLTAEYFGLNYREMMSKSRKHTMVEARRMAINICLGRGIRQVQITDSIGIPHDVLIHHKKKWAGFMEVDPDYAFRFESVQEYVLTKLNNHDEQG